MGPSSRKLLRQKFATMSNATLHSIPEAVTQEPAKGLTAGEQVKPASGFKTQGLQDETHKQRDLQMKVSTKLPT